MKGTKIEWTDETVNFWMGCTKVSEGCKFCYLYRDKERYGQDPRKVVRTRDKTFYEALSWKEPQLIFTCSWSDFFIPDADLWRDDAWDVIRRTPQHQWQILTKRPELITERLPSDWGGGYDNVWLGVSVESVAYLHRIKTLTAIPAKIHFLSVEPLLSPIPNLNLADIEWLIIGGESGNDTGKHRHRPCELEWIEDIVSQGKRHNVPTFVKQLGTHLYKRLGMSSRHGDKIEEFPPHLRIRGFPPGVKESQHEIAA